MARLILASASPRRRELLAQAGFSFIVHPADVDESVLPGEEPTAYVTRLAREKAQVVFDAVGDSEAVVLGADTTVVLDKEILGKPIDKADAVRMLRGLSGRTHRVITGVAVVSARGVEASAEVTEVRFREISEAEIAAYVETSEPLDKAGAYGIQGRAGKWIPRIEGCYFNVVGLPLARVSAMLEEHGGG
ncbi:Maf family protein [Terracidiphilus sp.]|jgi:septum formation protein|uniref:Maf family protein n=1 Tax=Terracidiphilus sp. TaxID=1964191 RepID=UPI003C1C387D